MPTEFLPGDIIACYGADAVSRIISYGTYSPFAPKGLRMGPSHVAILAGPWENQDDLMFVESTTKSSRACLIAQEPVAGVQAHTIFDRLGEYHQAGGYCKLFRLTPIDRLTWTEVSLLWKLLSVHFLRSGHSQGGIGYDYGGALISGTRVLKFSRLLRANLDKVFCSELIAALLMRLNRLGRSNPTRFSPVSLLRKLVRAGTYQDLGVIPPPLSVLAGGEDDQ